MDSITFANHLIEAYPGIDRHMVQHLSMFLSSDQRESFFDFIGLEY
jgi:hypothetical protein